MLALQVSRFVAIFLPTLPRRTTNFPCRSPSFALASSTGESLPLLFPFVFPRPRASRNHGQRDEILRYPGCTSKPCRPQYGVRAFLTSSGLPHGHRCRAEEGLQGQRAEVPPWYVFPISLTPAYLTYSRRQERTQPRSRGQVQGGIACLRNPVRFPKAISIRSVWRGWPRGWRRRRWYGC